MSENPISPFLLNYDYPIRCNYSNPIRPISLRERLQLIQPLQYHEYFGIITPTTRTIKDGGASIRVTDRKFRLNLDVQHFSLADITVKYDDLDLVIEGKHDEKEDEYGFISREFTRTFIIPRGCDLDKMRCMLCSDGVLTITIPRDMAAYTARCLDAKNEELSQASDKE